jgi:uncharacterized protein with NAD-binding domain and iron-sulfur cluster
MRNVAVIGAGISGLAAAYLLSRRHRVHLFEQQRRLGGHTNTVVIDTPGGRLPLDTGFLVHNDRTYPNLVRLFGELGVATRDSDMSFAVSCRRSGLEYSSRGVNGFFADRRSVLTADVLDDGARAGADDAGVVARHACDVDPHRRQRIAADRVLALAQRQPLAGNQDPAPDTADRCSGGRRRVAKSVTDTRHGSNDGRFSVAILERATQLFDEPHQIRIGNEALGPQTAMQLRLGYDSWRCIQQ